MGKTYVTKDDIVRMISRDTGYPQSVVESVYSSLIANISKTLAKGERVRLFGLGIFETKLRAKRTGRNPSKDEPVPIPERLMPTFTPSEQLKKIVQNKTSIL